MKFATIFFALAATLIPSVIGHGFLASIEIDGKVYKGLNPDFFGDPQNHPNDSPIRLINSIEPVKGTDNRAMNCGPNARPGTVLADAKPGSNVAFNWSGGSSQHWPHNIGPVLTYLASCGDVTCDKFDPIDANWFKIDELGQKPQNLSQWFQFELFIGNTLSAKVPETIAPGNYMLRHEVIGLHNAEQKGEAEFYPSCIQLRIGQNPGETVQPSETVRFPGAYSDNDPGIFVPTIFNPVKNYKFPGPAISNVVTASIPRMGNPVVKANNSTSPVSGTSASCKRSLRPRKVSRVMAHLKENRTFFF